MKVYSQVPPGDVQAVLEAWAAADEHLRYVHSLRLLVVAAARFRARPTQRISDAAALELQSSASLFEQQLRLLTCLARLSTGAGKPWSYWQQQNLKNLMEMAAKHDELGKLVPFLDRVTPSTHGPPLIERHIRQCQFMDRDERVTWSWEDYFRNRRALTLAVLACANLESFRQLIEIQILVRAMAPARPGLA